MLQDQHFDLPAIEERAQNDDAQSGDASEAMTALIEGDANHVEDEYVKGLPAAQRKQYAHEQQQVETSVDKSLAGVPPFISFLFGAPYEFGPLAIRVLVADGGNAAINAALTGPTPTSAVYVQTGLLTPAPDDIRPPQLYAGDRPDGATESFGAFELYLTFALKLSPQDAVRAADAVIGGRAPRSVPGIYLLLPRDRRNPRYRRRGFDPLARGEVGRLDAPRFGVGLGNPGDADRVRSRHQDAVAAEEQAERGRRAARPAGPAHRRRGRETCGRRYRAVHLAAVPAPARSDRRPRAEHGDTGPISAHPVAAQAAALRCRDSPDSGLP